MTRRPPASDTARLALLHRLAALRADRSAARLARAQAAIDTLEVRAASLREPLAPEPDPRLAAIGDVHERWRRGQLVALNREIAGRRAHAEPLREAQARDRAREMVLARLSGKDTR